MIGIAIELWLRRPSAVPDCCCSLDIRNSSATLTIPCLRAYYFPAVEIIIREVYNCFPVLVYLMILIATAENIVAVDQVGWIVDVVDNVGIDIVDVVGYIIASASSARARLLANVSDEIIFLIIITRVWICCVA